MTDVLDTFDEESASISQRDVGAHSCASSEGRTRYKQYIASAMGLDIDGICTCVVPAGHVPRSAAVAEVDRRGANRRRSHEDRRLTGFSSIEPCSDFALVAR